MNFMRAFHVLVLAALVLSGASPACEFISGGKSLIEICAADGSLKTIAVDDNQTPTEGKHQNAKKDCAFCFAQTHLKSAKAGSITLALVKTSIKADTKPPVFYTVSTYITTQPRAPPVLLS